MPIFAAVPVQRLGTAKSRLASILSAEERRHLVLRLLDNVLAAVEGSNTVDGTIVVSPDPDVLQYVRNSNVIAVEQHGSGLNAAIRLGRDHARALNSDAFLVILADLPRLTSSEIDRMVGSSRESAVTLAPDRHGHGTNSMILRPPSAIEPAFGVNSFHKHHDEAVRLGLAINVFQSPGTAFDIDGIDDLVDLGWFSRTHRQRTPNPEIDTASPTRDLK